ncbi:hypothetical protein CC85DRAFT_71333 [Cutaneotrichosporon oleaginosum]|uniref:Uncharacterized protein n=1 Tax=Cutaneotrichosporon oleaginosum TaxID=879819 RepID=A0A0J1B5S1_9TREE|nr:uncharacterized protein CC85DRAFT_71333 [Cutaneotrichosporon oleaginosum]KLT43054.1 hypothetical protein CC85DRAFT_71333 [Cutaneotrichosporon oleaginosum]TXT11745.1 hypothetical protein COLE_02155 [Cutaneotrichosporon oleaginosum]
MCRCADVPMRHPPAVFCLSHPLCYGSGSQAASLSLHGLNRITVSTQDSDAGSVLVAWVRLPVRPEVLYKCSASFVLLPSQRGRVPSSRV